MSYSYNRQRQAAVGPTPANRAAQTMAWPVKLTQMAKKALEAEDPNKALQYLGTTLAHLETVMLELGLPTNNLRKANLELRGLSKSYEYDPQAKFAAKADRKKLDKLLTEGSKALREMRDLKPGSAEWKDAKKKADEIEATEKEERNRLWKLEPWGSWMNAHDKQLAALNLLPYRKYATQ